jgi:hypothetical protein
MYPQTSLAVRHLLASASFGLLGSALAACSGQGAAALTPASQAIAQAGSSRSAASGAHADAKPYTFTTLNDSADPTFNQLLGINNAGVISGYFGSGAAGHPNQGYTLNSPYGQNSYTNENYPGSVQTQVVAINNVGDTAGFWIDADGNNFGFVEWNGVFTTYRDPHTGSGTVNQILGLNDKGEAVGFYVDGNGLSHGFKVAQGTTKYSEIVPPGGNNVTAAGINNAGYITGFLTASNGTVVGFLDKGGKSFTEFSVPNSTATTPFGINKDRQIVGAYTDAAGNSHGFVLSKPLMDAKFTTVDDPNGVGTTLLNGINDKGDLVGFYTDAAGNTDGFLAAK